MDTKELIKLAETHRWVVKLKHSSSLVFTNEDMETELIKKDGAFMQLADRIINKNGIIEVIPSKLFLKQLKKEDKEHTKSTL